MTPQNKTAIWRTIGIATMVFLTARYGCNKPARPAGLFQQQPGLEQPQQEGPLLTDQGREEKVLKDAIGLYELLNIYWTEEMKRLYNLQFAPPAKLEYYRSTGNPPCGDTTYPGRQNAYWCGQPGDYKVEFDLNWLKDFLIDHPGGATTFLVLAHEWGHAVQNTWVINNGGDFWKPPYRQELQADCLAGVFLKHTIKAKLITPEVGDSEAIYNWLEHGGGPWLTTTDHGTKAMREAAFEEGFDEMDTNACRQHF